MQGKLFDFGVEKSKSFATMANLSLSTNNKYAVIISGGSDPYNNWIRFWNDCSAMYKTLKTIYGFTDDHIYVLMSDGTDPGADRHLNNDTYDSSPLDLDNDGVNDVKYAATKANINTVINTLSSTLTPNDYLFIFSTDHGGTQSGSHVCMYLWGESISDDEFAQQINKVQAGFIDIVMEQCFSGGFIPYFAQDNRIISTACTASQSSYATSDNLYDEFVYHWISAVKGSTPNGTKVYADANNDGIISMQEAFNYAQTSDSKIETPQYNSTPNNLGQIISLNCTLSGPDVVYSTANYSVPNFPSGANVIWSISPSGGTLYIVSQNNGTAVIGNHGWYSSTFTLTATITGLSSNPIVLTKSVTAMTGNCPSISATYTIQPCNNQSGIYNQTANVDGTPNYVYYGCPVETTFITSGTISCQLVSGSPTTWFFNNNYLYMATSNPTTFKISFAGDDGGLCSKTLFFYPTGIYHIYSLSASPNPTSSTLNVTVTATDASSDTTIGANIQSAFSQVNSYISPDDISKQNTVVELYELATNKLAKRWNFADGLTYQLNVSDLRRGIYIMKVFKGDLQLTSKVVLK